MLSWLFGGGERARLEAERARYMIEAQRQQAEALAWAQEGSLAALDHPSKAEDAPQEEPKALPAPEANTDEKT